MRSASRSLHRQRVSRKHWRLAAALTRYVPAVAALHDAEVFPDGTPLSRWGDGYTEAFRGTQAR
jgi:hypothetical protein